MSLAPDARTTAVMRGVEPSSIRTPDGRIEIVRFGLFGGPVSSIGASSVAATYKTYGDYVVEADRLGFTSVFLTEHHFTGMGQASFPLGLLAHFAARTERIRLGTAVTVVNWYNPLTIAEQAATVDVLSGGRLDFGVGRGFRAAEYDGFCIPMDEASARYDDALAVILKAWREPARWSHDGDFWHFADVLCEPRPLQAPHPPIWTGASSAPSLALAAERGFNLLLDQVVSFEVLGERAAVYRERQAELGIDPTTTEIAAARALYIVDTPSEREAAINERTKIIGAVGALAKGAHAAPENRMAADYLSDARVSTEQGAIIGDASECADRLNRIAEAGIDYVLLQDTSFSGRTLRRFVEDVVPKLNAVPSQVG